MSFVDRLKEFQKEKGLSKKELSKEMGVNETMYNLYSNGKRKPSKPFLEALEKYSGYDETWWLYGLISDKAYLNKRKDWDGIVRALDRLYDEGLINSNTPLEGEIAKLLLDSISIDLQHKDLKREITSKR